MPHILIIDDDEAIRLVVREGLEAAGHTVTESPDGDEGLTAFNDRSPDLVITDIMMPRTYGLQVIRTLRKQTPPVPIIAITGYQPSRLSMAEDLGANVTLQKPFSIADLVVTVAQLTNEATSPG